ncbi:unnamed protein product [Schistocephalus solidus]|uniref:Cyclin-dependent kinase 2-associated protein 1 n=1 Tax=Schistocephalus solidus TaxID=70667 RepID=A0A183SBM2_SCHSO|nr:unnamed protein product [Schistocephalus solidus]
MASAPGNSLSSYQPSQASAEGLKKYAHLLQVIEEMGRDIKPSYANNKNAAERLKKNIHSARILVRECVMELERVIKRVALRSKTARYKSPTMHVTRKSIFTVICGTLHAQV